MNTVLVQGRISVPHAPRLAENLGEGWRIVVWDPAKDDPADFPALAAEADVIVGGAIPTPDWPPAPRLRLFQIPWAGVDFTSPERMPEGVPVCNTYEHETCIAEYVMLGMLEWSIGLRRMDADFREKGWNRRLPGEGVEHGELRGARLGIVGWGHIAREVAARARAFGMTVAAVRRSAGETPEGLEWIGTRERLDELLSTSDFVLIACDLNEETEGMIDAGRLAAMKPTGVIVNVSRGRIIDEDALYEALAARRIGGAVIDVWWTYQSPGKPPVWPSNRPFQELDNVILSAHESGWTRGMIERRWRFVAENLERVMRGETPRNLVFTGTGG